MNKLLPPVYLFVSIIVITLLHLFFPIRKLISFPWNLIGLIPLLLGLVINILANTLFKNSNTTVKPFEKSTALVTNGMFQVSRNPMYLGFVCILLGIAILVGSLSPYLVVIIFAVLMDRIFVRTEEKMLEKKFGKEWQNYKKVTRRWI